VSSGDVVLIGGAVVALWVLVDLLTWILWPVLWADLHKGCDDDV
tara:strand:- start:514 stop:645 length:132 start_codon:yes stop_codon:yes gene_type:complete